MWASFEIFCVVSRKLCLNEMKGKISAAPDATSRDPASPHLRIKMFDWLSNFQHIVASSRIATVASGQKLKKSIGDDQPLLEVRQFQSRH